MSEKHIAVVGESKTTRRFIEERFGKDLVHGGWTNDENFLGEIRALKELNQEEKYGVVIVDVYDWQIAAIIGERISDGVKKLNVPMSVVVLDERRCAERQAKIILVPRKAAEVIAAIEGCGITPVAV